MPLASPIGQIPEIWQELDLVACHALLAAISLSLVNPTSERPVNYFDLGNINSIYLTHEAPDIRAESQTPQQKAGADKCATDDWTGDA